MLGREIEVLIIITTTDAEGPQTESFTGKGDVGVMKALKDADAHMDRQFEWDRKNPLMPPAAPPRTPEQEQEHQRQVALGRQGQEL